MAYWFRWWPTNPKDVGSGPSNCIFFFFLMFFFYSFHYYYYSAISTLILCLIQFLQLFFLTPYDAQASSACSALIFKPVGR